MSTLTGVIKAVTRLGISETPAESELFIEPWYFVLSSGLYAVEFEDGIVAGLAEPLAQWGTSPVDIVGIGLTRPIISRKTLVKYLEYSDDEPETLGIGLLKPDVKRIQQILPDVYEAYMAPESLGIGLLIPTVSRKTLAVYIDYTIPEESISVGLEAPIIKRTNT